MLHWYESWGLFVWLLLALLSFFFQITLQYRDSLENSEILRCMLWNIVFKTLASAMLFLAQSTPRVLEKPSAAHSCSSHPLNISAHSRQAENKDQLSVCPQRVACAPTRGVAANPAARQSSSPAPVPVTTAARALPCLGDLSLEIQGLVCNSHHLDWKRLPCIGWGGGGEGGWELKSCLSKWACECHSRTGIQN